MAIQQVCNVFFSDEDGIKEMTSNVCNFLK